MNERGDLQALQKQRAALSSELGMKVFTSGEEEYEHLQLDLKALGLGHQQLQAEEDHVMFNPGKESEAHLDLDNILRGEKIVGGAERVLAVQDMDWDDHPWFGMEW